MAAETNNSMQETEVLGAVGVPEDTDIEMAEELTEANLDFVNEQEKPKKKRKGLVIFLATLAVILAAVAALEFVPGSPYERTIRHLFDPKPVTPVAADKSIQGDVIEPEAVSGELRIDLMAPADWVASDAIEQDDSMGSLTASYLDELKQAALDKRTAGTLAVYGCTMTLVPTSLDYEPSPAYGYLPSSSMDEAVDARDVARAERMSPILIEYPMANGNETRALERGSYAVEVPEYIFDEYGFAWRTTAMWGTGTSFSVTAAFSAEDIIYWPVDYAEITEEEFGSLLELAPANLHDAMHGVFELANASEPPADESAGSEDSEEQENTQETGTGRASSTTTGGGSATSGNSGGSSSGSSSSSSSGGSSGGSSGSGTTSGSSGTGGSGSSGGSSSGSSGSGSTATHTHTLATREIVETTDWVEHVEGHYETVHHAAVYNDWNEPLAVCNDCGATISGHAEDHLSETGHSGYHSEHKYHHDLVSEAWDEEVWVEAHDEVVGYKYTYYTETYCTTCGEVISRVQN